MEQGIKILIVDDERIALRNLEYVMKKEGYEVRATSSGKNALKYLNETEYDLVLTDLRMDNVDGMQILQRSKDLYPDTEVIMITGFASIQTAIEAMKQGAYQYVSKPFKLDEVRQVVREAAEKVSLKKENRRLRESLGEFTGRSRIIGQDPALLRVLETAREVAPTDCTILITGESGTGKELIARYVHLHSKRSGNRFIPVNCGAFTEELLANELFGHERGAYTGAAQAKQGLIEAADGGTMFLDEITEMSPSMQVKLLRVIQENEFNRIGGTQPVNVDVRYIAATNRNMQEVIAENAFRQDLYYRLNVVTLHLPALVERQSDIPLLGYHFLKKYAASMEKEIQEISDEAMAVLSGYNYPGNVRELENIIERGVALAKSGTLEVRDLPEDVRNTSIRTFRKSGESLPSLDDQEKSYIQWVLGEVGGNRTKAAEILGIDRVSLWRKLKRYGLEDG